MNSCDSSTQLGKIYILVYGLSIFAAYVHRCVSGCLYSWDIRQGGVSFAGVVSSGHHVQYLCWYMFLVEYVVFGRDVVRC